jgi:hypothetical protein
LAKGQSKVGKQMDFVNGNKSKQLLLDDQFQQILQMGLFTNFLGGGQAERRSVW